MGGRAHNTGMNEAATTADHRRRILAALVHIQQHLDEKPDLDRIAAVAHFSPFHFHRVFRGLVGEGVAEHVRRLRLERAAYRLKYGEQPIVELALEAGFEAHESFTRSFSAHFGVSPSAFRKEHRQVPLPRVASGVHYSPDGETGFSARKGDPSMDISIESFPARRVVFVRHTGPYDQVGAAWMKLFTWAGMRGLLNGPFEHFGLCHDDPDVTPPDKIRYDACIAVSQPVEAAGDVGVQEIPAGQFATAVHIGPYSGFGAVYAEICGPWAASAGRSLGPPPSMEFYLNDPRTTPPEQLRTKICIRLA